MKTIEKGKWITWIYPDGTEVSMLKAAYYKFWHVPNPVPTCRIDFLDFGKDTKNESAN